MPASKVGKCVINIFFVCLSTHKVHNHKISLCVTSTFVALLKVNIIVYTSMHNHFFVSTNSPINVLYTHTVSRD